MKRVFRFLGIVAVVYAGLLWPWPGVPETYASLFRTLAGMMYATEGGALEVVFQSLPETTARPGYTRVELADRAQLKPDGSGPVRHLDFDTWGLGWRPTALVLALVLAAPMGWRHKRWGLLWGLLGVQGWALVVLGISIWKECVLMGFLPYGPIGTMALTAFQDLLVGPLALGVPLLIGAILMCEHKEKIIPKLSLKRGREREV